MAEKEFFEHLGDGASVVALIGMLQGYIDKETTDLVERAIKAYPIDGVVNENSPQVAYIRGALEYAPFVMKKAEEVAIRNLLIQLGYE